MRARRRHRVGLSALGLAALVGVSARGGSARGDTVGVPAHSAARQEAQELYGGVLRPADAEPAITLTDTAGARDDITTRNPGKVVLAYFGYTHCPDVCLTTMADIATALRQSSAEVRQRVTVVFVTVDPHRDSLPVLRRWLDNFDPSFVGLRGSLARVVHDQRAASLRVSRVSRNGKTVEHSAEILAYTPDGAAHVVYTEGPSTIGDLRHDLPILVNDEGYA